MNPSWFRLEFSRRHVIFKVGPFYAAQLGEVSMVTWGDYPLFRRIGLVCKFGVCRTIDLRWMAEAHNGEAA